MISKSDKSDEVKIFKNTSVFTVRLHHRNVDKTRKKTCKNPLLLHLRLIYIRRRVGTPSGPRFGSPLGSQNRSQIDPEAIWKGIGYQTSILEAWTWLGGGRFAPWIPGPKIDVPTSMPFQRASGMVWDRFWLPK